MVCEVLLIEVPVIFYQPVCHNCPHLAIVSKLWQPRFIFIPGNKR